MRFNILFISLEQGTISFTHSTFLHSAGHSEEAPEYDHSECILFFLYSHCPGLLFYICIQQIKTCVTHQITNFSLSLFQHRSSNSSTCKLFSSLVFRSLSLEQIVHIGAFTAKEKMVWSRPLVHNDTWWLVWWVTVVQHSASPTVSGLASTLPALSTRRSSNFCLVGSHKITLASLGQTKFPLDKVRDGCGWI